MRDLFFSTLQLALLAIMSPAHADPSQILPGGCGAGLVVVWEYT